MLVGQLGQFGTTLGHQGLVRRHDRDPASKGRRDVAARRLDPAHDLHEDVEITSDEPFNVGCEQA